MEFNILEKSKYKVKFELKGETHTFCNMLVDELWKDETVKVAAYKIEHPLVAIPQFIIETNNTKTVKKALQDAVKRLMKQNDVLAQKVKEL